VKAGFYQFSPRFGQVSQNLEAVASSLAGVQANLIVLPELFATGYQFVSKSEVEDLAEPVPGGPTTQCLMEIARRQGMFLVAGLAESDRGRYYNSAVLVGPMGLVACYRKTHLFFEETLFFAPGDTGFRVWDIGIAKVGILICFDWLYPEAARTLALEGADVLCHPSNLVLPHCPDAMITRCLENGVFSITANRIGVEERGGKDPLRYIGQSEIVTPTGAVLHRASRDKEEMGLAEIDPYRARVKSLNPYNDLFKDRRRALYEI
jgi:predicted amidohydrolase